MDDWPKFEAAWTVPILRQSFARQVWQALTAAERTTAITAARGYVAWRHGQKKPPNTINAHTFLREREAWPGFIKQAPPEPRVAVAQEKLSVPTGSDEFEAIELMRAILRAPFDQARPATIVGKVPCGAAALKCLIVRDDNGEIDKSGWFIVGKDTPEFTAWCQRIKEWLGYWPDAQRIWLNEHGEIVPSAKEAAVTPSGLPRAKDGLLVPINGFPPAKGN